jgi:hypothetical protein
VADEEERSEEPPKRCQLSEAEQQLQGRLRLELCNFNGTLTAERKAEIEGILAELDTGPPE